MRGRFRCSAWIVGGAVWFGATPSIACEPAPNPINDRVAVAEDGSFENAGRYDDWRGRPVQDLGGGIVVQRQSHGVCGLSEWLLVVDCETVRAVDVQGRADPSRAFSNGPPQLLELVLYPTGPLIFRQGDTLDEIVSNALELDIQVTSTLDDVIYVGARDWDRPNPFLGCRLFYPDSPGARE